jgi:hypothetical protein
MVRFEEGEVEILKRPGSSGFRRGSLETRGICSWVEKLGKADPYGIHMLLSTVGGCVKLYNIQNRSIVVRRANRASARTQQDERRFANLRRDPSPTSD